MLFKAFTEDIIQSVQQHNYFVCFYRTIIQLNYLIFYLIDIASGGSEDWTRGTLGVLYSYCIELPPTGGSGFIVPTSEIKITGKEIFLIK
jgi:hypothetical protein